MIYNRNTILAVILSGLVLIAWQYFYNVPAMEKQRALQQAQSELVKPAPQAGTATTPQTGAPAPSATAPAANQPAPAALGQHFAEGRADRRSGAGAVPRDRRSGLAADRAVFALRHREPLLCGV